MDLTYLALQQAREGAQRASNLNARQNDPQQLFPAEEPRRGRGSGA